MKIRQLIPDEWEMYRDIRLESLRVEPDAFMSKHEDEASRSEADWRKRVSSTTSPFSIKLFAVENERAAGMAGLFQDRDGKDSDIVNVFGVYVSPDYRGKGISSQLLAELIRLADEVDGVKIIRLTVKKTQLPAISLYQKYGFKTVSDSEENPSYLMELTLKL